MKITTIGVDLGKGVVHAVAVDASGGEVWRRRYPRRRVLAGLAQVPGALVAMECGSGAQYFGRELAALGHEVRLIPPQHVKPYRSGNKHDFNDARAIAEAASRRSTRTVAVKTVAQQELLALHRVRQGYVRTRTATINQWRGLVAEYGEVMPKGVKSFQRQAPAVLERLREVVGPVLQEWLQRQLDWLKAIEAQVRDLERTLKQHAQADSRACLLMRELAGIGPLTATAIAAQVGDGSAFGRGRDMAAWVGVVPGQHSTGGRTQLLGISKRGDSYLRTLLIHGGRAVVRCAARKRDPFSRWVNALRVRRGVNVAAVAVANKNVRMAHALLRKQAAGLIN